MISQVKIVGNKRNIHLKNPLFYWTDENYDVFLNKIFGELDPGWTENVLKRIAKNDEWY